MEKGKGKKILITVGGTGGHIFPAFALVRQIQKIAAGTEIFFAGGKLSTNPYFLSSAYPFQEISCSPLQKDPLRFIKSTYQIAKGCLESSALIRTFTPDVVVGFGSYHTFPLLVAAAAKGVPIVLHEANSIPGKVNRYFSSYAELIGIHFPTAASLLKGNVRQVALPLREGFIKDAISTEEARKYFGLNPDLPTLLIFGGSQGADAINKLFLEEAHEIFKSSSLNLQILHFTGQSTFFPQITKLYASLNIPACVKAFEPRMDLAWQAATFCISRAGAASIAEQLEYEVPGILIPYPYASDHHQEKNADFMVSQGLGFKFSETSLNGKKMRQGLEELHRQEEGMRWSAKQAKSKNRFADLGTLICELINL